MNKKQLFFLLGLVSIAGVQATTVIDAASVVSTEPVGLDQFLAANFGSHKLEGADRAFAADVLRDGWSIEKDA